MVATEAEGNGARAGWRPRPAARRRSAGEAGAMVVAPPSRRVRVPELAVGVLVMAVFSIGVVMWHLGSVDRVPALAVAGPVARGDIIARDDLRIVNVSADQGLARLDASAADRIVGRTVLVDLPAGALVTDGIVAQTSAVGAEEGIVGLSLEPGQYPSGDLAAGDYVMVVASGGSGSPAPGQPVAAEAAEVVAVEDLSAERKLVSLRAPEDAAQTVASLAPASVRLVLVTP